MATMIFKAQISGALCRTVVLWASPVCHRALGRVYPDTTTRPRLCPKDQPQHVKGAKAVKRSHPVRPRRAATAGAPHTAVLRFPHDSVGVSRCVPLGPIGPAAGR